MEKMTIEQVKIITNLIEKSLDDKKASEINVLEVAKQTVLADYFVIATGTSSTHIKALAEEVEFQLKEQLQTEPLRIEGANDNGWVLMDYGCTVVHIFTKDAREFYKLDKLWEQSGVVDNSEKN